MMEAAVSAGLATIALIIWLVKLEAKANRNTELIIEVQRQLETHLSKCEDAQVEIIRTLIDIKQTVDRKHKKPFNE